MLNSFKSDDILNFHLKHQYIIDISKTHNGCLIKMPANYFSTPELQEYKAEYKLLDIGMEFTSESLSKTFYVSDSVRRPAIITDIILRIQRRNMTTKLMLIYDGLERKKSIKDIIQAPSNEKENRKEKIIFKNLNKIISGNIEYNDMDKLGVGDEFIYLVEILNNSGLI